MDDYFMGWRRTLGCVTLVIALMFSIGWVRSTVAFDLLGCYYSKKITLTIISEAHLLGLQYNYVGDIEDTDIPARSEKLFWGSHPLEFVGYSEMLIEPRINWHHYWVYYAARHSDPATGYHFKIGMIPYWTIVIPLTLVSAHLLLLGKSRQSPQVER